ncbi:MAG: hypothetical protein GY737_07895 [Desulfobacteraceae bacterium]|nr:hypothetical protein [Desulfobacteraceae bacterium]
MNINSVSGSHHYFQAQNLEAAPPATPPAREQTPETPTPAREQRDVNLSNEAYQVSITNQGREALRAEQANQEPPPANESPPTPDVTPRQDQGSTRLVDLVA